MKIFGRLAALLLAFAAAPSYATITCNVTVTSITTVYSPTVATDNVSTGSYTISCNRLATDANSLAWSLAANNGLQSGGGNNRAQSAAGNRYSYDIYVSSSHINANKWQGTTRFTGTLSFGASLSASASGSFDLVVYGSQAVQPASSYNDTVTVTLRNTANNSTLDTSPFTVTVITTNSCQIATPPGNINLTYTSFQASPATANTSFDVRCTTALPYTMALDATSGTIVGLNYTLALSQTSATGNGIPQTYSVNGSIAGGQAGTCSTASCSGSQTRTLTVTY
jgi:spore coat protein U-like protein